EPPAGRPGLAADLAGCARGLRPPAQAAGQLARAGRAGPAAAGPGGPAGGAAGAGAVPGAGVNLTAPAKINLCLRLGPRRGDGFHRIATVFAAIELRDRLELEPAAETTV